MNIERIEPHASGSGVDATADLPVVGMTCANCARAVERALSKKTPGIKTAMVNFAAETVHVEYDPGEVTFDDMAAAVDNAGYTLVLPTEGEEPVGHGDGSP